MKAITTLLLCLSLLTGCASTTPGTGETSGAGASAAPGGNSDVTGQWRLDVVTDLGSGTATFVFRQAGGVLTGEYDGVFGPQSVTGTISGDKVAFSFIADAGGQKETIAYSGTVKGSSMSGDVALGDQGSGTFNGERE